MSRRTARKHAFFLIFQIEFHAQYDSNAQTELYFGDTENNINETDAEYIKAAVSGTYARLSEIDAFISNNLSGWDIDRINKIDLALIRLAVYEIMYMPDIPERVSINEAVEMAKAFGTDESYQFVNGILGNILQIVTDGKTDG